MSIIKCKSINEKHMKLSVMECLDEINRVRENFDCYNENHCEDEWAEELADLAVDLLDNISDGYEKIHWIDEDELVGTYEMFDHLDEKPIIYEHVKRLRNYEDLIRRKDELERELENREKFKDHWYTEYLGTNDEINLKLNEINERINNFEF